MLALSLSLVLDTAIAQPAYELNPVTDGAILAATVAIGLAERRFLSLDSVTVPLCTLTAEGLCDPSELHPLDSAIVGRWNEDWGMVTDVALIGAMTLPYGIIAADSLFSSSDTKTQDMVTDSAVVLEAFLISNVAVITLKHAIRRPRPSQFTDKAPAEYFGSLEHQLSFPSGHAAAVSSAMTATTVTYWLRHPDSPARWVLAGTSLGLTTVTALGRVQAGKHFPSDVVTGTVIGAAIGLVIPWIHRAESELQRSVSWTGQRAQVSLSGQF